MWFQDINGKTIFTGDVIAVATISDGRPKILTAQVVGMWPHQALGVIYTKTGKYSIIKEPNISEKVLVLQ